MKIKTIRFLGDSLERIKNFPADAKQESGYQLDQIQRGREPNDWKSFPDVGAGVREIRIKETSGAFRVMYVTKFAESIYVLHAFQKKTQKTEKRDINLAKQRYKEIQA